MATGTRESDGLALLQEHRPEAIQAYQHLLGTLGRALEPRTRQLVLISLQVAQGSARALRHHVPRALEAGASRDEVLDAVTLALPVVGLSRATELLGAVADLLDVEEGSASTG